MLLLQQEAALRFSCNISLVSRFTSHALTVSSAMLHQYIDLVQISQIKELSSASTRISRAGCLDEQLSPCHCTVCLHVALYLVLCDFSLSFVD